MNALKHYRWGLACDAFLALLGSTISDIGEVSGAFLATAIVHSIVASLIYYRGTNRGGFSKMDHGFLILGQLGILLCILFIHLLLLQHYFHPSF